MKYFAGIDLGGTFIKCGIFDENCKLLVKDMCPTDVKGGYKKIALDMANLIKDLCKRENIKYIESAAICSPGVVDSENGIVAFAGNLGFRNTPLCGALSSLMLVPVYIANDANIAALGEFSFLKKNKYKSMILITLGTGIGGGFILNGKIYEGYKCAGGEFGHQVIRIGGVPCTCGRKGCFESYCSTTALVRNAREQAQKHNESLLYTLVDGKLDNLNGKIFFEAVRKGDIFAKKVLKTFVNDLAEGIANVVNLFRPEAIVIGGGISAQKDLIVKPLRKLVNDLTIVGTDYAPLAIEAAQLGNDAGMYGSAQLSIEKSKEVGQKMKNIINEFAIDGEVVNYSPFGEGHINDTFMVVSEKDGKEYKYLLQAVNGKLFTKMDKLINNIKLVTEFISEKIKKSGKTDKKTLNLIPTKSGKYFVKDSISGNNYRMYNFIENTVSYQIISNPEIFYQAGLAFGDFANYLADFDATKLYDVLPNFHNTVKRYEDFQEAVLNDVMERAHSVKKDIAFVRARKKYTNIIVDLLESGKMPLKVTHNDTKINNVMMDAKTNEYVAVVDLDTVMQGSICYDYGDAIRFGCNTSFEDEKDLSKVNFDINLFEQFTKGYLKSLGKNITPIEKENLVNGAIIMTYECGMRFLGDYLNGDTYFKTNREGQNLDRARTQFKLVSDMEENYDKLVEIVNKY